MNADYLVHDRKFQEARANGWDGWGGNVRIAHGHIWMERLFSVKQIPTSGHILELGCGEGNYTRRLAQRGYHVTGVDISQTAIDWAKEKLADTPEYVDKITYLVHDLTQPNILPNQSFDLVVDGNCLHCIIGADRRVFLQNVYRLLVDGGIFFISTICSSTDEACSTASCSTPWVCCSSSGGRVASSLDIHILQIKQKLIRTAGYGGKISRKI
ncbi:MAG: class I SAM-dependent methyltransferase [Chloroflexota bacterium]